MLKKGRLVFTGSLFPNNDSKNTYPQASKCQSQTPASVIKTISKTIPAAGLLDYTYKGKAVIIFEITKYATQFS